MLVFLGLCVFMGKYQEVFCLYLVKAAGSVAASQTPPEPHSPAHQTRNTTGFLSPAPSWSYRSAAVAGSGCCSPR